MGLNSVGSIPCLQVRAVGSALGSPGAATRETVQRVGNDVSTLAGALVSWQEQVSEAISAALAARREREKREQRAREAQAWIERWHKRKQQKFLLPDQSLGNHSQPGSRSRAILSKAQSASGQAARAVKNAWISGGGAVGGLFATLRRRLRQGSSRDQGEQGEGSPRLLSGSVEVEAEVSVDPEQNPAMDDAVAEASVAHAEVGAANRMLLSVNESGENASAEEVDAALQAAEEAIGQASAASKRVRAALE